MVDAEVLRLRRLRNTVLRARALAAELELTSSRGRSAFSRAAVSCWQIARIVTGRLRAHPYLSYQREPGELRTLYGVVRARLLSRAARYGRRDLGVLSEELKEVMRELDDARALTWSAELSDTFGRSQARVRRLITEIEAGARKETGAGKKAGSRHVMALRADVAQDGARNVAANWPYLAF